MDIEAKKPKLFVEKFEFLDESTGQIILKEETRFVYTNKNAYTLDRTTPTTTRSTSHHHDNKIESVADARSSSILIEDYDTSSDNEERECINGLNLTSKNSHHYHHDDLNENSNHYSDIHFVITQFLVYFFELQNI
jgi:hypothetical protein